MKHQAATDLLVAFDALPDCAFVRLHQLRATGLIPFSDVTAWRRVKEGTFPRPIRISSQVTAWRVGDVREWLKDPSGYSTNDPVHFGKGGCHE